MTPGINGQAGSGMTLGLTRGRLVAIGIAVFLAGLIARFPANAAMAWFVPEIPGVSLGTASGTVWSGQLSNIQYRKLSIPQLAWELAPTALLTGTVRSQLEVRLPDGELQANVARSLGGSVRVTDLRGNASLALASRLGVMPAGLASGEILLNFSAIELENGKPVAIDGRGALTGLRSSLMPELALGDYEADISTSGQAITGNFRDLDAPVEISGSATLTPDGQYSVSARLRARPEAPEKLREGLKFLGPEDAEGRRQFDMEGRL